MQEENIWDGAYRIVNEIVHIYNCHYVVYNVLLNDAVFHCGQGPLTHLTIAWDCGDNYNLMQVFAGSEEGQDYWNNYFNIFMCWFVLW
jgi:hypothetical protein